MFCSYQEMYMGITDEKLLMAKRLEMVRFAFNNGWYKLEKAEIKKIKQEKTKLADELCIEEDYN